jgi:hypothetical protein
MKAQRFTLFGTKRKEGGTMKREMSKREAKMNQERNKTIEILLSWVGSVAVLVCTIAVAFCMLSAGAATVCLAAPPPKGSCDALQGTYEKLKCKHDNVANQIEYMTDQVFANNTLLGNALTEGQKGQLKSMNSKSKRSRAKSIADDFKKLAKSEAASSKNSCRLVPLSTADDDGICEPEKGEKCAAIELDALGNLQECNPAKKNKGKGAKGGSGRTGGLECDQICDPAEALTGDESTAMEAEAAPMSEAYDALETELYNINGDLDNLNSNASTLLYSRSVSVTNGSCDMPETTPGLDLATGILRQVSVTARGLAGMSGTGCEQVAVALGFGGNGSVVCLVFETAASILEIAYVTTDQILITENNAVQSATLGCLQKIQGDMSTAFTNLYNQHSDIKTNDNNNTAKIMNQIEQVRAEVVRLLNTPQGQRSAFPVK